MGRAQVVQAEACGLEPDVRMNPILLKPTTDVGSQVIVNGQVRGNMRAMEYYAKKREFLPDVMRAYESLAAENDVIVIEGAGSPAEINLKQDDFVNMGLAKLVDAPVLLIGDIDRAAFSPSSLVPSRFWSPTNARASRARSSTSSAATGRFWSPAFVSSKRSAACRSRAWYRMRRWTLMTKTPIGALYQEHRAKASGRCRHPPAAHLELYRFSAL